MCSLSQQPHLKIFADTCSQKRDAGICPGNVSRFYFDKKLGSCRLFTYGGCGGNSNNFASVDDCVANCGGPAKHAGIGARNSKQGMITLYHLIPFYNYSNTKNNHIMTR